MKLIRLLILMCLCTVITACATSPQSSIVRFVEDQKRAARALQQEDRLAESLAIWQSLLPLGAPDEETASAIETLNIEIDQRVTVYLSKAKAAYARGRVRQADVLMLQVLALKPGHPQAMDRLGRSESARASRQQVNKKKEVFNEVLQPELVAPGSHESRLRELYDDKDYTAMLALAESLEEPLEPETAELVRFAHIGLADEAQQAGQLEVALEHIEQAMALQSIENDPLAGRVAALRQVLSARYYQRGSRLIKSDLPQAITALEASVSYNPDNSDAKDKLVLAQTLQRNLRTIEGVPQESPGTSRAASPITSP
jgi:tetratricopeptide (TPR) repeat protein